MHGQISFRLHRPLRPSELLESVPQLFVPIRQIDRQLFLLSPQPIRLSDLLLDLGLLVFEINREAMGLGEEIVAPLLRPFQQGVLGHEIILKGGDLLIHALELGLKRL